MNFRILAGWQSMALQITSKVLKRIAFALPSLVWIGSTMSNQLFRKVRSGKS